MMNTDIARAIVTFRNFSKILRFSEEKDEVDEKDTEIPIAFVRMRG